jgi:hypothetical protein
LGFADDAVFLDGGGLSEGTWGAAAVAVVDGRQKTYRFDQAEAGSGQGLAGRSVVG